MTLCDSVYILEMLSLSSCVVMSLVIYYSTGARKNQICFIIKYYPGYAKSAKNSLAKPNYGCQVTIQVK